MFARDLIHEAIFHPFSHALRLGGRGHAFRCPRGLGGRTVHPARHPCRGSAARGAGHRVRVAAVPRGRRLQRRQGRRRDPPAVRPGPVQGRAPRSQRQRADGGGRGAAHRRRRRFRRHQGIRQGNAQEGDARRGPHRRPPVRQGPGRPCRAGAEAPVHQPQPLRRRGGDHGDAHRAQPGQPDLHRVRRRACEDQEHPHRRQPGFQRIDARRPVRPGHRWLAQLVHQVRPLRPGQAQRRPGDAALLLPVARVPRIPGRFDPGRDLAQQGRHQHHRQRDRGRALRRLGREDRRQLPGPRRRVQVADQDQAGRGLQRRRSGPDHQGVHRLFQQLRLRLRPCRGGARSRPRQQPRGPGAAGRAGAPCLRAPHRAQRQQPHPRRSHPPRIPPVRIVLVRRRPDQALPRPCRPPGLFQPGRCRDAGRARLARPGRPGGQRDREAHRQPAGRRRLLQRRKGCAVVRHQAGERVRLGQLPGRGRQHQQVQPRDRAQHDQPVLHRRRRLAHHRRLPPVVASLPGPGR